MSKQIVVTGSSRGIGLGLARLALEQGHRVTALARHPDDSRELQLLKSKYSGQLAVFAVDVLSDDAVEDFAKKLGASTPVDLLINNAGAYLDMENGFEGLPLSKVVDSFAINSISPMRVTRALLPGLSRSKEPRVVHITSLMGSIGDNGSGGSYAYRMSKTALNMFNKSFSIDFPGITSVVVHPGWVQTRMGGEDAPTTVDESASGILKIGLTATRDQSGHFYDFEGDSLPW